MWTADCRNLLFLIKTNLLKNIWLFGSVIVLFVFLLSHLVFEVKLSDWHQHWTSGTSSEEHSPSLDVDCAVTYADSAETASGYILKYRLVNSLQPPPTSPDTPWKTIDPPMLINSTFVHSCLQNSHWGRKRVVVSVATRISIMSGQAGGQCFRAHLVFWGLVEECLKPWWRPPEDPTWPVCPLSTAQEMFGPIRDHAADDVTCIWYRQTSDFKDTLISKIQL